MRMIDELIVRGEPAAMAEFKARLEAGPPGVWERESGAAQKFVAMPMPLRWMRPRIAFRRREVPEGRVVKAWLREDRPDELALGGMIAEDRRTMDDQEYNAALGSLLKFLEPPTSGLDVRIERIPFRVKMEEIVTDEAMRRLEAFIRPADRSSLEPFDRARWRAFVTQVHRDGSALYSEELDLWLRMGGWPEDSRRLLIEAYDNGLCLLKEYDEERVG